MFTQRPDWQLADNLDEAATRLEQNQFTRVPDTVAVMREAAKRLRKLSSDHSEASWRLSEMRPRFDSYGQHDGYYQ